MQATATSLTAVLPACWTQTHVQGFVKQSLHLVQVKLQAELSVLSAVCSKHRHEMVVSSISNGAGDNFCSLLKSVLPNATWSSC